MKHNKILLIIPAYNEEKSILNTVNTILEYNTKNKTNYDYIVINDGSRDSTEEILTKNKINHIKLIQNLGIGGAVQTGYKYARINDYDIAIQYDGDGQHDVSYVKDIVKPIIEGEANMVIGSRFVDNNLDGFKSSSARRAGIKLISGFIRLLTFKKVYDPTSGFRAVDKKTIEFFSANYPPEYPEPVSEVTVLKKKLKIKEVPVKMKERQGGKSSIHAWKSVYYMINVFIAMFIESIKRY